MKKHAKRILTILQLPPPVHGASIMNSYFVNSEIIKSNFNIRVVNLQFAISIKELKKFSFLKILKAFLYCFEIVKNVISFKPDLVYFTISPIGFAFYRDSIYVFLLKLFNNKIVFHLHGKGIKENLKSNAIKKYLYQWAFKNTHVICLSQRLTNDIEDVCKSVPFIVPNGIQIQPEIKEKKIRGNGTILQILYLSHYIREKGILILIDALRKLKNQGHIFNARLVGEPVDLKIEFLQNLINDQNLSGCVQITGPLYGDDKITEFQNADIFVFPTYYLNEAFPLVNLEAMQYSLPVISTFEGGIPDIVIDGETGFLVEAQNPEMLSDKIATLLRDKNLRIEMGRKGFERFNNYFTLNHFENNMYETFQTILDIN